jgi:hypothetical protein
VVDGLAAVVLLEIVHQADDLEPAVGRALRVAVAITDSPSQGVGSLEDVVDERPVDEDALGVGLEIGGAERASGEAADPEDVEEPIVDVVDPDDVAAPDLDPR